jgi:quinol monooxygenase YgiN
MTTVLFLCRVADYDTWRPRYDAFVETVDQVLTSRVLRGQDDPNLVVLIETFESREIVDALMADPKVEEAMIADGVDLSSVRIEYLDDVGTAGRATA